MTLTAFPDTTVTAVESQPDSRRSGRVLTTLQPDAGRRGRVWKAPRPEADGLPRGATAIALLTAGALALGGAAIAQLDDGPAAPERPDRI